MSLYRMGQKSVSVERRTIQVQFEDYLPAFPPTAWERGLEFSMENKWEPLSICALHVP